MQQNLYSPNRIGKPKTKTGFANATSARMTLKNIAPYDLTYQKQVVITMYPLTGFEFLKNPNRLKDIIHIEHHK
jgi:hypothetical protein